MLSLDKTEYEGNKDVWQVVNLEDLPRDSRRALTVQMKEFIHWLDETDPFDVPPARQRNAGQTFADWEFERLYRLLSDLRSLARPSRTK